MPKLQAACTMTATDGMNVHTRSGKAAGGQAAVLEFLLINHPLDCPVCDKGGECPLQDLTYRYGPGQHALPPAEADVREARPGVAADRPRPRALHPLLPLHPLLRRRGRGRAAHRPRARRPLGHRHVRGAAVRRRVLRQRGRAAARWARSPRPSTASGPGRGRSTTSRPSAACARPAATPGPRCARARRPAGARRATTPRSTRAGCATRAASRHGHLTAPDRHRRPLLRGDAASGGRELGGGRRERRRRLRHYVNLYGPDSRGRRRLGRADERGGLAWARPVEAAGGGSLVGAATPRPAPGSGSTPTPPGSPTSTRRTWSWSRATASCTTPPACSTCGCARPCAAAPTLVLAGAGGTPLDRNADRARPLDARHGRTRSSRCSRRSRRRAARLPGHRPGRPATGGAAGPRRPACTRSPAGSCRCRIAPNERGVRLAGFDADPERAGAGRGRRAEAAGAARRRRSGLRLADAVRWRAAVQKADAVVAVTMFPNEVTGWAHVIVPATAALEKEGSFTNLEGRTSACARRSRRRPAWSTSWPGGRRGQRAGRRAARPTRRPCTAGSRPRPGVRRAHLGAHRRARLELPPRDSSAAGDAAADQPAAGQRRPGDGRPAAGRRALAVLRARRRARAEAALPALAQRCS